MSSRNTRCFFCNRHTEEKIPNDAREIWQEPYADGIIRYLPSNATMGMMHITIGRWIRYSDRDALWCRNCIISDCGVSGCTKCEVANTIHFCDICKTSGSNHDEADCPKKGT